MKILGWLIFLFVLAVGITLAGRYNSGYVLLVIPPYRVELSVNLFVVLIVGAFLFSYGVTRATIKTLKLPARVREFHQRRARERAHTALIDALKAFFEGRYGRASKSAAAALKGGEAPALSAIVAARAEHELRAYHRRDLFFIEAETSAPDEHTIRVMAQAETLLDERRNEEALEVLKTLSHKHTAALRLELRAQQRANNWDKVLELTQQLEKREVLDELQATQLRRHAHIENLKKKGIDINSLHSYWQKLPGKDKRDNKIAAVATRYFIALNSHDIARQIIEESLDNEWDTELIALYTDCTRGDTVSQIERAERWLKTYPGDATLLLVLGKLCAQQQLWGKAQNYLEASLSIEPSYSAHVALAELKEKSGHAESAQLHYRLSLELALSQLRQMSGGRRRTAL